MSDDYEKVSGRDLSTGWLADIHAVDEAGERLEPVTMWLAAVTVVRQALGFGMYTTMEPQWRQLVTPDLVADRIPGQWLIPLDVKALSELALDGVRWDREVSIYEDRYLVHVEIAR